ncbi:spermidine putrescine ABC superfamily ATP binding cassette transporter, permease protein [Lentilactobacillus senioris DSM 24302 = JCM 17472]|uniref:Spermidine putrescine ABC superfamily ATP binding cassette transporter, permease protein n=1 Tax=Lentilactobacillus senioris DSM 24302 = JCM 17472 TaxID=1423802 RepID=A0A0R2CNL0_9LACO|nr:ABC transporter permease [Lentilactobacillus senioris]KRM93249.1 spermidine putrescine ABC superfamily ATP binding cassette transporter, permease protein [Lentilactobacillus senioris DSM 24302 = JCM 17472]
MKKSLLRWQNWFLIIVFVILYAPIVFLIAYSFSSGTTMDHFGHLSGVHYIELLSDKRMLAIFLDTILIAILSSTLATIVGTLGAMAIHNAKHRQTKQTLLSFNSVLMVSPDVIIGASFLIFFTALRVPLGFWSVLLSHTAFEIPIVVLMILPRLGEMSSSLINASADLGASNWQTMSQIILPFISPGIIAGFFMAITYSLDDFAVTFFVTGNGFTTLSVEIYSRARQGISLEINALAGIMFIFSLILVVVYYLIENRKPTKPKRMGAL